MWGTTTSFYFARAYVRWITLSIDILSSVINQIEFRPFTMKFHARCQHDQNWQGKQQGSSATKYVTDNVFLHNLLTVLSHWQTIARSCCRKEIMKLSIKIQKNTKILGNTLDTSLGNIIPNLFSIFAKFLKWDKMPIHTLWKFGLNFDFRTPLIDHSFEQCNR